jgi:hypothetical protein
MSNFRFTPEALQRITVAVSLGKGDVEIAEEIGCDRSTIRQIRRKHGLRVDHSDYIKIAVATAPRAKLILEREAEIRGVTPELLASRVLNMVCFDEMFTALLD